MNNNPMDVVILTDHSRLCQELWILTEFRSREARRHFSQPDMVAVRRSEGRVVDLSASFHADTDGESQMPRQSPPKSYSMIESYVVA